MQLHNVSTIFFLLCTINLLNYIDRGIIPGSPLQFQRFITLSITGAVPDAPSLSHENAYLGLLVSAFIAGYSVFSIPFGYWAISCRPFVLIAIGLTIWCLAVFLCGLSDSVNSLHLLLVGRVLSGVGESSFQAIVPSFIEDFAPTHKRTSWLGLFYCGITIGTAAGYFYSALFATSTLRWPWAFYTEGLVMVPLVLLCLTCIPTSFNRPGGGHAKDTLTVPVSFCAELGAILRNPLFMVMSFASAAYVFTISGLAAFGPSLLIGLGLFDEGTAAMVFGAIIVSAGAVGTLLGGFLLDRACPDDSADLNRLVVAARHACLILSIGTAVLLGSWLCLFFEWYRVSLVVLALALTCLFGCVPASIVALLASVERHQRGLALGLNTLLSHVLGDVPSPIVLGLLKDWFAPNCRTIPGQPVLHPDCAQDRRGLLITLLVPYLWLLWAIGLAGIGLLLARRRRVVVT